MSAIVENIRIEPNGSNFGLEDVGPLISFDFNSNEHIEYLDEDGSLCAAHESNLHNHMDTDTANAIRETLRAWLAANAFVSVTLNGVEDFFVLNVPADADAEGIRKAIEAENHFMGGSRNDPLFVEADSEVLQFVGRDITVLRNGVEVAELRSKAA